jgi:hypothetical protein
MLATGLNISTTTHLPVGVRYELQIGPTVPWKDRVLVSPSVSEKCSAWRRFQATLSPEHDNTNRFDRSRDGVPIPVRREIYNFYSGIKTRHTTQLHRMPIPRDPNQSCLDE